MKKMLKKYLRVPSKLQCKRGATLVEYALLVALIAAVSVTTITTLGTNIKAKFNTIAVAIGP